MREDSYLKSMGLDKLGFKNTAIAFLKIAFLFPLVLMWRIFKFLFNPRKSVVNNFKKAIIFPVLEFLTGKSTSEKILEDYTYFHQAIIKKEVFENENIKLNFEAHKSILLNSKIATFLSIFVLIIIYEIAFEVIGELQLLFFGLAFVTGGLTSIISFAIMAIKALLVIALFAVEINLIRSLFVTEKEEIKDYLDETIFYADVKNAEIFGEEHAKKVKETLYDAYLTEKEEIKFMDTELIDEYLTHEVKQLPTNQKPQLEEKKEDENSSLK